MRALIRHRSRWCGWLIAVLLYSQLATAAYACPQFAPTATDAAAGMVAGPPGSAGTVAMAEMPDCDGAMPAGMDPDQPQLCKAHCEAGKTSTSGQPPAPEAPAAAALGAALLGSVGLAEAAGRAACMPAALADGPPLGSPPLYLCLLVLRN